MTLHWILHPATPYMLLAAGLGMCLYLFATLQRDIRRLERRFGERFQELEQFGAGLRAATEELKAGLEEAQERAGVLVAPVPPKSGLNLSKRSHVLRMSRRGETPPNIATALSLPQNEVDLLLKVHRIMLNQLAGGTTDHGCLSEPPSSTESGAASPMAAVPGSR